MIFFSKNAFKFYNTAVYHRYYITKLYCLLAGNPAYGRLTRPRVEGGASPLGSISLKEYHPQGALLYKGKKYFANSNS